MKKLQLLLLFTFFVGALGARPTADDGFITGTMDVKSINALAFGPENVLFLADSKSAKVFALKVTVTDYAKERVTVENVDQRIAEALGVPVGELSIQDMAVHQQSGTIFLAVHHLNSPALFSMSPTGDLEWVAFDDVTYAEKTISNPIDVEAKDRRGRTLRRWAISDLHFANNQLMVTGLSNREFGSTFRSMEYPFTDGQMDASLEIYHAAHGQYETHAPVKTFTTTEINGSEVMIASYTCTPLVLFPMSELTQGEHHKGRTVAELGAGNSPLDMVIVQKDGKKFLLMNNNNRPVMKIAMSDIESFKETLTEPVDVPAATEGVDYINLPMVNVVEMDNWGADNWVMLKRNSDGSLNLISGNEFWL